MKAHSITLTICLIISTGCLGAGYIFAGYWLILPAFLVMGLIWILMKKQPVFWSASTFLLAYIILAAVGIIANLSTELMIITCTTALASWDLIQFNQSIAGNSLRKKNASLERYHLHSLAVAASAGLFLAFIGSSINLHLPFGVIVILVLVTMGCLIYSVQYILKIKQ